MNASPYHSKVKVTLRFVDTQFPAGGVVTGKMELECKAEKGLGISMIMAELYAVEGELHKNYLILLCGVRFFGLWDVLARVSLSVSAINHTCDVDVA